MVYCVKVIYIKSGPLHFLLCRLIGSTSLTCQLLKAGSLYVNACYTQRSKTQRRGRNRTVLAERERALDPMKRQRKKTGPFQYYSLFGPRSTLLLMEIIYKMENIGVKLHFYTSALLEKHRFPCRRHPSPSLDLSSHLVFSFIKYLC